MKVFGRQRRAWSSSVKVIGGLKDMTCGFFNRLGYIDLTSLACSRGSLVRDRLVESWRLASLGSRG